MKKIIQGVHQFRSGVFEGKQALFERLANSQTPEALFVTCSDSRINPNLITQTEPGDLFLLRNAGNLVPPHGSSELGTEATVEYAVKALGVRDIIVCGHSGCGAITALLNPEMTANLPQTRRWLEYAQSTATIMSSVYANVTDPEERLNIAIQENALQQLVNLRTIPVVAAGLITGDIHLHAWVYQIESGIVFAYDAKQGQFVHLGDQSELSGPRRRLQRTPVAI
jgi:carbonic anhydrase